MSEMREAYDLRVRACRVNVYRRIRHGDWKKWWFIRLIISDTWNRVCSRRD